MGCEVCLGILTAQPTRSRKVVLISWSRRSDDYLCSKPILNLKLNLNLKLAYEEEEIVLRPNAKSWRFPPSSFIYDVKI